MAYYLKGIGDIATRENEILPSFDARILKFIIGHTVGILSTELNKFSASTIDRGVVVRSGVMQAYGYFGMSDSEVRFNFVMPSIQSYIHIYAEIDLSVVPNKFSIKQTDMSNSNAYTFRQDNLESAPNGKYQLPLFLATLTASTITLSDKRTYIDKIKEAVASESASTSTTQPQTDNSNRVATTGYVRQAVSDAFNITEADIKTSAGVIIGKVRRQGNFVICEGDAYGTGYGVTGIIPEGFRPKRTVYIGVSGSFIAFSQYPNNQIGGGTTGSVTASGTLSTTVQNVTENYLYVLYTGAVFYGGWEIT